MTNFNPNAILFLEADCNYTRIHWSNQPFSLISKTMKKFYEAPDFKNFVRISRGILVNPHFIQQIQQENEVLYLKLTTGQRLRTARRRKELIVDRLMR